MKPIDNSSPQSSTCVFGLVSRDDRISSTAFERAVPPAHPLHFSSVQFQPTTPNHKLLVPT